jgi:ABC-2 type transport system permease protein
MKTIVTIAQNEIKGALRDKRVTVFFSVILLLVSLSVYLSYVKYSQLNHYRQQAAGEKRYQWLHQDPKHPHMAAHFGNFAFKPVTPLNWIDYGVDNYTGTYVYMEPHHQNDFVFTPAMEMNASIRLGELSPALIFQLFVPLLIIFMCFATITKERENGVLKLLYAQGIPIRQLVMGKILGYYSMICCLLLPLLVCMIFSTGSTGRFALLILFYGVYFFIITSLSVLVSAIVKSSRASLMVLLGGGICFAILIPRITANIGADLYTLPSREAFYAAIALDIKKGINGHDPDEARKKEVIAATLRAYHVDSLSMLPVNIEGIFLQKGEEYSSMVYDIHFGEVQNTISRQNGLIGMSSFINPWLAIRSISMALSFTDPESHIHFQKSSEDYRRKFVQYMNENMTLHSKADSWATYKVNYTTYSSAPVFNYTSPSLSWSLKNVQREVLALLVWLIVLVAGIKLFVHKIPVVL